MADIHSTPKPFTITIRGGGLAGLLLAIGLSVRNVPFKIFELAPEFSESSAGLGFGANAVRAMEKLDPRIHEAYVKLKTENKWEDKKDNWFDVRKGWFDVPSLVTEIKMAKGHRDGGNVLRRSFLMELVKLLPKGCVEFGKTLVHIDCSRETPSLHFLDGSCVKAVAVVGCDGIRSPVRKSLLGVDHPANKAVFSGTYLYRVVVGMKRAMGAVGEELALNSQIYLGQDSNVVTYTIEDGKLLNVVAFRRHNEVEWKHEKWVVDSSKDEMNKDFSGMGHCVQKIIQMIEPPQRWAIFDMPPAPFYSNGRVALLGDAAHASTSHASAGAGMAVEDAFIVSELISNRQIISCSDIPVAFSSYNIVRIPRTQELVRHSRESGQLYQMRRPGSGNNVEKIKETLGSWQNWIWEINLDCHLEEGENEVQRIISHRL